MVFKNHIINPKLYLQLKTSLFLTIFITLFSCKGHEEAKESAQSFGVIKSSLCRGDTVTELSNNIMVIYQDKRNNYWFGSWKDGVFRYDGKTILHYSTKHGLSDNRVEDIKEDKLGNIYFNTSKGVNKFDGQRFSTLSIVNTNEWKLEKDDIWFKCMQGSGHVYRYDGTVLHRLSFPAISVNDKVIENHPNTADPYSVYCIYTDSKGNVWFGTAFIGVCRYNGKTLDWITEEDVTELHNGPANGVRSIIEDKEGYFWFNSNYRYKVYNNYVATENTIGENGKFYTRVKSIGNLDGKEDSDLNEYLSITKDRNNDLWIAMYKSGVWFYDGKKTSSYLVKDGAEEITLFYIYKDNVGTIWLGTHEHGAYRFDGTTFKKFGL